MCSQPPTTPADQGPATGHPPTDHPPGHSLREAAALLGITPNAVRQRVRRGTLTAVKTDAGWRVHLPDQGPPAPADHPPAMAATAPTGQGGHTDQGPADHPPSPVDLAPLVNELHDLRTEVQRLTEAATVWQLRARQAEDRLAQLTAGGAADDQGGTVPPPGPPQGAAPVPEHGSAPSEPPSVWRRLRRWLGGTGGIEGDTHA